MQWAPLFKRNQSKHNLSINMFYISKYKQLILPTKMKVNIIMQAGDSIQIIEDIKWLAYKQDAPLFKLD